MTEEGGDKYDKCIFIKTHTSEEGGFFYFRPRTGEDVMVKCLEKQKLGGTKKWQTSKISIKQ